MNLARLHNWALALEYNIQQRELAALSPLHDLSTLDHQALSLITTCLLLSSQIYMSSPSGSGLKSPPPDPIPNSPHKQPRLCFQCGFAGHMPVDCKSESTTAGHSVAQLASGTKSRNTLLRPNNKVYCFNWAKDLSCSYGSGCTNLHTCSLCGDVSHGARNCRTKL